MSRDASRVGACAGIGHGTHREGQDSPAAASPEGRPALQTIGISPVPGVDSAVTFPLDRSPISPQPR